MGTYSYRQGYMRRGNALSSLHVYTLCSMCDEFCDYLLDVVEDSARICSTRCDYLLDVSHSAIICSTRCDYLLDALRLFARRKPSAIICSTRCDYLLDALRLFARRKLQYAHIKNILTNQRKLYDK